MVDYTPWAAILISCISLCVAIITYVKSAKTQDKTVELQQRLVHIEEGRDQLSLLKANSAKLRAELQESERNSYRLCIANDGNAPARNVRVELGGMSLVDHPAFPSGAEMPNLVGPRSEIKCGLSIHLNCATTFALRILWDDGCGVNQSFETTLTSP